MPTSNETRVRRLGFSNTNARPLPRRRAWPAPCFCFCFSSAARRKIASISSPLTSLKFKRSRLLMVGTEDALLARQNFFQNFKTSIDLSLGDDQRRDKPQNFVGRAVDQQSFLHAGFDDLGSIHLKLKTQNQSFAANASNKGKTLFEVLQPLDENFVHFHTVRQYTALEQSLHHRQTDVARKRVSAERGSMAARNKTLRDRFPREHGAQRQAASQRLCQSHDVG